MVRRERSMRVPSSSGYAEYRAMRTDDDPRRKKQAPFVDDLSRFILLLVILAATVAGYFFHSHVNNPANILRSSVKKTLKLPYTASIEGRCAVGDSVLSFYRSREYYTPGKELRVLSAPGEVHPENSRALLDRLMKVRKVKELDREDMYGHPTRHFYGELTGGFGSEGSNGYFEYWVDFKDSKAVRLLLSGVVRNVAVSARGDSLSRETSLNILFRR